MENEIVKTIINKDSIYYQFGDRVLGPFLYGFTLWLIEKTKSEKIDKIIFLSRDGYMMKIAYEQMTTGENAILCNYFHCSRKSLRYALLWKYCTYEESLVYFNIQKSVSVTDIFDYYGLDAEERDAEIIRLDISYDYTIPYQELKKNLIFKNIFDYNKEKIIHKSKKQDELLLKYMQQINFMPNTALVDIGWHGSMQFYFEEFIKTHNLNVNLTGYYVGIYSFYDLSGKAYGYLFEDKNDKYRKKVLCSHGIIEKLLQCTEGTTTGYFVTDSNVYAKNDIYEYQNDQRIIECIKNWQEAAINRLIIMKKENVIGELRDYAMNLIRFGMYPSRNDIKIFSFMYNMDGEKYYYLAQKSIFSYTFSELKNSLIRSPWKTGFLKSLLIIPIPYYWIYYFFS